HDDSAHSTPAPLIAFILIVNPASARYDLIITQRLNPSVGCCVRNDPLTNRPIAGRCSPTWSRRHDTGRGRQDDGIGGSLP
ncbi:hypothetical protein CDV31_016781, partial [Fusarium ambrosium]